MHILNAYRAYFNHARPHQSLEQRIPVPLPSEHDPRRSAGQVQSIPLLGALHHRYELAA